MAITRTEFTITSSDTDYQVPGDLSASQVVAQYASTIQGLSNMTASEQVITRDGVQIRSITFTPRTGNKGGLLKKLLAKAKVLA